MGRKIPGRKHRGVKDPEKQRQKRFASIKDKINAPPKNPEEQQISKSLSRVIELKNRVRNGSYYRKYKKPLEGDIKGESVGILGKKTEKPIPEFKQHPDETDRAFLNRINRICQNVTKEAAFEDKYGVEIKRNKNGEIEEVVKRPKDELETLIKKLKKKKKGKVKKNAPEEEKQKLTKSQKWHFKKIAKKIKRKNLNIDEFARYQDHVKFGEVIQAPPNLIIPNKADKSEGDSRPGKRDLLFKHMLNVKKTEASAIQKQKKNTGSEAILNKVTKIIDKKGKRKGLPNALRRQLDKQQQEVIEAYKQLKVKKYNN